MKYNFSEKAEKYAKQIVLKDCPGSDWVNIAHDWTEGYKAGLEAGLKFLVIFFFVTGAIVTAVLRIWP